MIAEHGKPAAQQWRKRLKFDPLPPLLSSGDEALTYFVRRDLLAADPGPLDGLWTLPGAQRLLKKQLPDGSAPGRRRVDDPNLVAALDSLSRIGISIEDKSMQQAAGWLITNQEESGLWKQSYVKPEQEEEETARAQEQKRWISLAICRVLKRLYG